MVGSLKTKSGRTAAMASASPPPAATQILCSADMIEDYNNAMLPPCAATELTFCAITNAEGQTELLAVSDDGKLLWMYPDKTASSGWSQLTTSFIECPSTPGWLRGFYTFNESGGPPLLMVFYGPDNFSTGWSDCAYGMQYDGTAWTSIQLSADASTLLSQTQGQPIMSVPIDIGEGVPRVLVYGMAYTFSGDTPFPTCYVLGPAPNSSNLWSVYFTPDLYSDYGVYIVSAQAGCVTGTSLTILLSYTGQYSSFGPAEVKWFSTTVDWSNATITYDDNGSVTGFAQWPRPFWTIPVLCAQGFNSFIDLDGYANDITNWVADTNSSSCTATSLVGGSGQPQGGISFGAGLLNGVLVVFVLEKGTNLLWMLQQTDASGGGAFTWTTLGDYGTAIAVPPTMSVPQVVIFDDQGNINLLAQNADGSWFKNAMATPTQPSQPPVSATTYTFELTAADANGNPVRNTVLSIEPDTPQTLVVNNIAYPAAPGTPVLGVADAFGRVTVAALAGALASPELSVAICGTQGNGNETSSQPAGTFRADYLLHNRMAGNDAQFPVNQQAYTTAGLLPSNIDSGTATTFCQNMRDLAQGAVNMANGGSSQSASFQRAMAARPSPRAFVFDFSTRGAMICRDMTDEELVGHRARILAPDSIFSKLWGDIAHFFKHAWQQVKKIAVEIGEDITIAINDAETYVMKAIDDIRDAIEVVLQALNNIWHKVDDFIKKAIEWLKALFDWQDVINTKDVLKWFFQQNISNLQQLLASSSLQTQIVNGFTALKKRINDDFGQLGSVFGGNTFNDMAPSSSTNPMLNQGPPLQAAPLQKQWHTNSMRSNYVTSKVSGLPGETSGSTLALVNAFEKAFKSIEPELKSSLDALFDQIKSIKSLSELLNTGICALLTATQDIVVLVVDAIQGLIDAILTAAADALSAALAFLDKTIDIPIISALYQKIAESPLTILDLLCLIIALPCTILYKIFFGGSEATAPFTTDQTQKLCSSSFSWPWFDSSTATPQDQGPSTEAVKILSVFGPVVGFATMVTDAAGDVLNASAYSDGTPPPDTATKLIGWTNVLANFMQIFICMPWNEKLDSTANRLDLAGSIFPLLPCLTDVICLAAAKYQVKFIPSSGPGIIGVLGAAQLSIGIATVVEMNKDGGHNDWDKAGAILNCCSPLIKFGTYAATGGGPVAATVAGAVMAVFDICGDEVVPIVSMISALDESS